MKAHIIASGDPSVGISETHLVVDTGLVDFSHYEDARNDARQSLVTCYSEILGEHVMVAFEDEYPS